MGTTYCELNYLHLEKMCVGQNTEYVFYKICCHCWTEYTYIYNIFTVNLSRLICLGTRVEWTMPHSAAFILQATFLSFTLYNKYKYTDTKAQDTDWSAIKQVTAAFFKENLSFVQGPAS